MMSRFGDRSYLDTKLVVGISKETPSMHKRHLISALKGIRHCIAVIGLWALIVGIQNVSAQSQLAQDTYAIFEASCLNCHGPDGAFRETLLMEHAELIDGGTVIPGNPDASELYKRLLGPTENGVQMPFGQPQLPAQSIDTVRRWILAGAPQWTTTRTTDSRFISPAEVLESIETHLTSLEPFDRAFARYFTLTHLHNAGERADILREYRNALSKLVNSLSWDLEVTNPQPIDPQATIFYINLRDYEWDRNDGWTQIEKVYPYHISFDAPEQTALRAQLGRLQTQMDCKIPSVHIDWFIATASTPPLYHELLSLPLTDSELETRLDVDVIHNLQNAPGVRVWRAGFNNSGVSNNNRAVERHKSRYGAYWKSYDFAGSVGTQNILTNPLSFTHDGGEAIFNLPNGLQGYYLVNASGFRLDDAPINIVSNPAASDPTVRNGISCIGCHTEGMKTFEDEVRSVIESNPNPPYNKAQALRLYVEKSDMDALLEKDMEKYRAALAATGGVFGGVEPVSRFHEAFQGPVDAAYAAAVVGLETETFLERVRENTGLQNVGLLALDNASGSVQRDTWTSSFRDVMYALDYPQLVGETPDITQPDILPGGQVHIPDPNLRAAIAEALGKNANAPITIAEMETLRELEVRHSGINDLTGLQFAINLRKLIFNRNYDPFSDISPIAGLVNLESLRIGSKFLSDLSPLAGLINLRKLHGDFTRNVSDLSPLAGLINLEWLHFDDTSVSDISPLAGLINLEHLGTWGSDISDLSPIAGLTKLRSANICGAELSDLTPLSGLPNLTELYLRGNGISDVSPLARLTKLTNLSLKDNNISDISPLAGLTGLEELYLRDNNISDISPLTGLTNLTWLSIHENKISDISPLARLTELTHLNLEDNNISDVSPLAGLIQLEWLNVVRNEISDLSPLDGLRENTKLEWYDNPIPLNGGPKIEGPWLWTWIPAPHYHGGRDMLAEATGGTVTELHIASHGAIEGEPGGNSIWTPHKLSATGDNNIRELTNALGWGPGRELYDIVLYGCINLYSPREQETSMYLGCDDGVKVWFNGEEVFRKTSTNDELTDYNIFFPVTLQQGKNILFIAIDDRNYSRWIAFFGFDPDTEYALALPGIGYDFSQAPVHMDDTFTLDIWAENVFDLAGWQFDLAFGPSVLEAIEVSEGDFLKTDGGTVFFQAGRIDNASGKITGIRAARLTDSGVSGSGSLIQVEFEAKSGGETEVALHNFKFGSSTGEIIPAGPHEIHLAVEDRLPTGDVNRDGDIDILDLILVARQLGKSVPADSPEDINGDGIINIFDLTLVAQGIGGAAAPAIATGRADVATIEAWIALARFEDDGSIAFRQGIENLENLLVSLIVPQETALLANYPNPFNPETWIPYQLATPAEVALTIYGMNGGTVRHLAVGHQTAGLYQSRSRALHWDGRNQHGEPVASGLYFYTLKAGEFTATRRMLIRK